ncbi:uncharacterized protein LOC143913121 [Arctopsyche grandis]|uniref:uncharacterized protein LOC143913121 n=1 Tax=Arctopsyche grandis TaxID=121162 RepID=UPI00406D6CB3
MECRLCLCSAPTVSIHDNPHPLAQLIRTCCRLLVTRGDRLPDAICLSCINNLELLSSFRNDCLQSNETSKLTLNECLNVKTEKVLLEDLIWEDESDVDSLPNVCNDEANDLKSSTLEKSVSEETHLGVKSHKRDVHLNVGTNMRSCTVEKPYKCDICLKSFDQKYPLIVHMRSHTGEKPYKCNICSKSFAAKSSLGVHMKLHMGEKLYKCDICLRSFIQNVAQNL